MATALLGQASIVIDQVTLTPGVAGISRDDGVTGQIVTLRNADNTNVTKHQWVLLRPRASAAVLSSTTSASCQFTPDVDGTFVVLLLVNEGLASTQKQRRQIGVKSTGGFRYPAQGESNEANWTSSDTLTTNETGWWEDMDRILRANQAVIDGSILTVDTEAALPASRRIVAGSGITFTDGGGGSDLTVDVTPGFSGVEAVLDVALSPENLLAVRTVSPPTHNVLSAGQVNLGSGGTTSGNYSTVLGGDACSATGANSVCVGGDTNIAAGVGTFVGGGELNDANAVAGFIGGGSGNVLTADYGVVGGGELNGASVPHTTVGGGFTNVASGLYATIAGGFTNSASGASSAVGGGNNNEAIGATSVVCGGDGNAASSVSSVIAGGGANTTAVGQTYGAICGGQTNAVNASHGAIAGGQENTITAAHGSIGGGSGNSAGNTAHVGGGQSNVASGLRSVVGGGNSNTASGDYAAILGGLSNTASGTSASIIGRSSTASATDSVAVGRAASSTHAGATVMTDGSGTGASSSAANQLVQKFAGGIRQDFIGSSLIRTGYSSAANYSLLTQGQRSTTDATAQTLDLLTIPTGQDVRLLGNIKGKKSSNADFISRTYDGCFVNVGGVITTITAVMNDLTSNGGGAGYVATVGLSGTSIRISFTGAAATTIYWTWHWELFIGGAA